MYNKLPIIIAAVISASVAVTAFIMPSEYGMMSRISNVRTTIDDVGTRCDGAFGYCNSWG